MVFQKLQKQLSFEKCLILMCMKDFNDAMLAFDTVTCG